MGRGSMYSHKHFMLIDDDMWNNDVHDPKLDFAQMVREALKLEPTADKALGDKYFIGIGSSEEMLYEKRHAWFDHYLVGIDHSGGMSCIFLEPEYDDEEEYDADYPDRYEDYMKRIEKIVVESFNTLIKAYAEGTFRYPTSSYTSQVLTKYPLGGE